MGTFGRVIHTAGAFEKPVRSNRGPAEHLARYTARSPEASVFLSSQGAHLWRSNVNRRVWQTALRAAGVEGLRVHDLCHTAGSERSSA